jgi:hypothetical protein
VFYLALKSEYTILDRAQRNLSGTQDYILGTCDRTNRSGKNSNLSLTSLTFLTIIVFEDFRHVKGTFDIRDLIEDYRGKDLFSLLFHLIVFAMSIRISLAC